MKKFTFMIAILASVVAVSAQNLLLNPSFETWTAGKPDSWVLGTTGTVTQSSVSLSGSALQIAATGTFSVTQNIAAPNGTFDTSKKYQLVVNYKTTAGDGTDERVWCNWITSPVGAATTSYWTMSLTDSLGLKGPGGNNQPATGILGDGTNGYMVSNLAGGDWKSYTYTMTPPAGATQFSFQIRTYNKATVIWDDLAFGEEGTLGLNPIKTNTSFFLAGKSGKLVNVIPGSAVVVYNAVGKKVQVGVASSTYDLSKLSKGMYIVRVGNVSKKITL